MADDEKKDSLKSITDEAKEIVEQMDTLSDDVGVSFWDGADIVTWLLAVVVAIIGLALCLETGGLGCLLTLLAIVLAAIDTIAKIADLADKDGEKTQAKDIEKKLRDLERRLRELKASESAN